MKNQFEFRSNHSMTHVLLDAIEHTHTYSDPDEGDHVIDDTAKRGS